MNGQFLAEALRHLTVNLTDSEKIGQRFYADVYRLEGQRVLKLIAGHRILNPRGFASKSEAVFFAHEICVYQEKLAAVDVPVVSLAETTIAVLTEPTSGRPFIVMLMPFAGKSAEFLFRQADSTQALFSDLADSMIQSLLRVISQPDGNTLTPVGIDAQVSNFVVNDHGCITYVDFTPPRYFSADRGYRVEYPQPANIGELEAGIDRYYRPTGILARWLTDCCRVRPEARRIFVDELARQISPDLRLRLGQILPTLSLSDSSSRREIIAVITATETLIGLRDCACLLASLDGREPAWLEKFFNQSRHHPGQHTADIPLDQLKFELLAHCHQI